MGSNSWQPKRIDSWWFNKNGGRLETIFVRKRTFKLRQINERLLNAQLCRSEKRITNHTRGWCKSDDVFNRDTRYHLTNGYTGCPQNNFLVSYIPQTKMHFYLHYLLQNVKGRFKRFLVFGIFRYLHHWWTSTRPNDNGYASCNFSDDTLPSESVNKRNCRIWDQICPTKTMKIIDATVRCVISDMISRKRAWSSFGFVQVQWCKYRKIPNTRKTLEPALSQYIHNIVNSFIFCGLRNWWK